MNAEDTMLGQELRDLVGELPPTPAGSAGRTATYRAHLESVVAAEVPNRHRRRLVVVGASVGVAVLVAAGSAAAYGSRAPATDTSYARCYTAASLDSLGTTLSEASTSGDPGPRAVDALEGCATVWRAGLLELDATGAVDRETLATDAPVPDLVACVLKNGVVGVFPGDDRTCFELGLPQLATG